MAMDPPRGAEGASEDASVVQPSAAGDGHGAAVATDVKPQAPERQEKIPAGLGPYRLAGRRLRRNKVSLLFLAIFLVMVIACLLAPVYSSDIAHIGPNSNNVTGTVNVNGKQTNIVSLTGVPIGPTWTSHYLLGADQNGRDVAVRLLYGGRNSLLIGAVATAITILIGGIVGLLAGFLRGPVDAVLRSIMELIWSFPVVLLGVAIGTALALAAQSGGGIGPLKGNSLLVPAFIIGIVYIPYFGKPVRAQALHLREQDFVDAARVQGAGTLSVMFTEILPNLASTIIVFVPLILAQAILLEAYLSFLGAGVQAPNASWGTLISDGLPFIEGGTALHLTLAPGIMLVLTVLSINAFGDGVRDALDPRAQVRIE